MRVPRMSVTSPASALFLAEDDFEQRGFARAVRPDDGDALAGLERERNVIKQFASAKRFDKSGYG